MEKDHTEETAFKLGFSPNSLKSANIITFSDYMDTILASFDYLYILILSLNLDESRQFLGIKPTSSCPRSH